LVANLDKPFNDFDLCPPDNTNIHRNDQSINLYKSVRHPLARRRYEHLDPITWHEHLLQGNAPVMPSPISARLKGTTLPPFSATCVPLISRVPDPAVGNALLTAGRVTPLLRTNRCPQREEGTIAPVSLKTAPLPERIKNDRLVIADRLVDASGANCSSLWRVNRTIPRIVL
jgi:hypothetical protein